MTMVSALMLFFVDFLHRRLVKKYSILQSIIETIVLFFLFFYLTYFIFYLIFFLFDIGASFNTLYFLYVYVDHLAITFALIFRNFISEYWNHCTQVQENPKEDSIIVSFNNVIKEFFGPNIKHFIFNAFKGIFFFVISNFIYFNLFSYFGYSILSSDIIIPSFFVFVGAYIENYFFCKMIQDVLDAFWGIDKGTNHSVTITIINSFVQGIFIFISSYRSKSRKYHSIYLQTHSMYNYRYVLWFDYCR